MNASAQTAPVQTAPHGKVLMERENGGSLVEMVYWGIGADPQITIVVTHSDSVFYLAPKSDDTMNAFLHPESGCYLQFAPPPNYKELYA